MSLLVSNNGKFEVATTDLVDVLDPTTMALNRVGRKANELHATPGELRLEFCECTELSSANRGVIFRVREQDYPVVANEFMEVDGTGSGLGVEVGSCVPKAQPGKCQ